jgi:hypothetical protein
MDATLVTAWTGLCQVLESAFTKPTFGTFLHVVSGWVLCRSRPTVANLVRTIGDRLLELKAKHWTTYERFFYRAAWSMDELSRLLLGGVVAPLLQTQHDDGGDGRSMTADLLIDDTTCGRCGRHVAYAGYFKDASASNTLKTVVHWAHNWVIGAIAFGPRRFSPWVTALPVLFALYRKPADCGKDHRFRTRQQLAAAMIVRAHEALADWTLRVAADGQYATKEVIGPLPPGVNLVSRLRRDAALYETPPRPRGPRKRGRPPKKGKRLPTPQQMARRRKKGWRTITVPKGNRTVERRVLPIVCLWYHVCKDRPIKLVIVRDPAGRQDDDFFFCTDATTGETEIVQRYYARWPIEEAIQDAKQHGGFEQVQGWCPRTVERQAPLALVTQTLTKAWYFTHGVRARAAQPKGPAACGWLPEKDHPSFLDMLATLRAVLWDERINRNSTLRGRLGPILKTLRFTLCAAA